MSVQGNVGRGPSTVGAMTLRILADDLTGALDTAAAFAGDVPVHLDHPGEHDEAAVSVVATATRDVPVHELPSMLEPCAAWLRGADIAFKKVDSLLRGNTFVECASLGRDAARVVLAPSYPRQGRVVVDGHAFVQQPGSGEARPIIGATLAEAFGAAWSRLDDARAPHASTPRAPSLWVPDVRGDADLDAIAAHALDTSSRGWLWCGSAGLAHALARVLGRAAPQRATAPPRAAGPVLLVSATRNPVLLGQWEALRAARRSTDAFEPGAGRDFRARGLVARHLAPPEPLLPDDAAHELARRVAAIVDTQPPPAVLAVVGGDTLLALARAAGTRSLRAGASVREGWGMATLVGGRWDGVTCLSRSGAFGGEGDLVDLLLR